jgi:hypothetical protein
VKDVLKIGCGIALGAFIVLAASLACVALFTGAAVKGVDQALKTVETQNCAQMKTVGPERVAADQTKVAKLAAADLTPLTGFRADAATKGVLLSNDTHTSIAREATYDASGAATAAAC